MHRSRNCRNGNKPSASGIRSNNLQASVNLQWTLFDGLKMFVTRDKLEEFERLGSSV